MGTLTPIERDPIVTAKEVAKHLQISQEKVYRMARDGEIPALRIGVSSRLWRFRISDIDRWMDEQQKPGRTA